MLLVVAQGEGTPLPVLPSPPCPSPGGGGGSPGQHKMFCYGSLCCCVGDCVVRHCHLYPLYSWQDILLTLAEMKLDSTTMFTPGTNACTCQASYQKGQTTTQECCPKHSSGKW